MTPRRTQGLILLVGAALTFLLVGEPSDRDAALGFHWLPLVLGVTYLVAAFAGGRKGSYWSTAIPLTAFGLGSVAVFEYELDVSLAATETTLVGAGVLLCGLLAERGWSIRQAAVGATVLATGAIYALQPHVELVERPVAYAVALGLVGLVRVVRQ